MWNGTTRYCFSFHSNYLPVTLILCVQLMVERRAAMNFARAPSIYLLVLHVHVPETPYLLSKNAIHIHDYKF